MVNQHTCNVGSRSDCPGCQAENNHLHYSLDGKTYNGISRFKQVGGSPAVETFLVVAWFDGECDLWLVEGEEGIKTLGTLYADADWTPYTFQVFTFHKAVKS